MIHGYAGHRHIELGTSQEKLREFAIAGDQSAIEREVGNHDLDLQKALQQSAIEIALEYGSEHLAVGLADRYPDSVSKVAIRQALQLSKRQFFVHVIDRSPNLLRELAKDGDRPMIEAAKNGDREIVLKLLAVQNPRLADEHGMTVLMYAALFGHDDIVRLICEGYPDALKDCDNLGMTPLMHGVSSRGSVGIQYDKIPAVVEELITAGSDVNAKDNEEVTVLGHALKGGVWSTLPQVVQVLRNAGAETPASSGPQVFRPTRTTHLEGLGAEEQQEIWNKVLAILAK